MNIDQLIIREDSKVVFGWVTGSFVAEKDNLKKYSVLAKALALWFQITWFEKIDRRNNQIADELSKAISRTESRVFG